MILYKNSSRFFQTAVITEYAENSLLVSSKATSRHSCNDETSILRGNVCV
jgi:hypothetical protein